MNRKLLLSVLILSALVNEFFALLLSPDDCPEKCKTLYDPVCGSNGQTYKNMCRLSRDNCLRKKDRVAVFHKGECLTNEEHDTEEFKPYNCLRIGRGKYLTC